MRQQTKTEERLNAVSHAIGVLFGLLALVLLLNKVSFYKPYAVLSVLVYSGCYIFLFLASTLYHTVISPPKKHFFRILDHIGIYLLIAGTYTPVLLLKLTHSLGWELFFTVWGIAAFGMVLKIFFTGKFEVFSTLLYLVMGWLIILDFSNTAAAIGPQGVLCLFAGGLFYTVGVVFYAFERMPYNHVIWHLFVLLGAISHFLMIYGFVI